MLKYSKQWVKKVPSFNKLTNNFKRHVAEQNLKEAALSKDQIFRIYSDIKEDKSFKKKYENIFGEKIVWSVMVVNSLPLHKKILTVLTCLFYYFLFLFSKLRRKLWKNSQ
jgi:hypothetical protein